MSIETQNQIGVAGGKVERAWPNIAGSKGELGKLAYESFHDGLGGGHAAYEALRAEVMSRWIEAAWAVAVKAREISREEALGPILEAIAAAEEKQHSRAHGPAVDRLKHVLEDSEQAVQRRKHGQEQFAEDLLVQFRALVLVLQSVGNADTHSEKRSRLRGAIELLETNITKLRECKWEWEHLDYARGDWPNLFQGSDAREQRLLRLIAGLRAQLKEEKQAAGASVPGPLD
jgi:hypothetical protein